MHGIHRHAVRDAAIADAQRNDPTRTYRLRAKMRAEGDRRWQTLGQVLRSALIEHDIIGQRGMSKLPFGDKTEGFALWLREELRQKVLGHDGRWLKPYVQQAAAQAQSRADEMIGARDAMGIIDAVVDPARVTAMESLAVSELRGVCEAAQQQITRQVTHCMMANATPTATANAAAGVVRVMRNRTRAMSEYIVAKTHATSTLSAFRSAGIRRVGIDPERIRKTKHGKVLVKDRPRVGGPGSRSSREETPSASTIGRIEAAQEELESLGEVEVITAGDSDVCPECEDISDGGPYDIDEAEDLIPAHAWCRCLAPDTIVEGEVLAASKAFYAGPVIDIVTVRGHRLTLTVNHPVLTASGFVAAGNLREGDQLVCNSSKVYGRSASPSDEDQGPSRVEDVFKALAHTVVVKFRPSTHDLYGDGASFEGYVHVAVADINLIGHADAQSVKRFSDFTFVSPDASGSAVVSGTSLPPSFSRGHSGPFDTLLCRVASQSRPVTREMFAQYVALYSGFVRQAKDRLASFVAVLEAFELATFEMLFWSPGFSHAYASGTQTTPNDLPVKSGSGGDLIDAVPGSVEFDEVTDLLRRDDYAGHVYDLQTTTGWFFADGIVVQNCAFVPLADERFAEVEPDDDGEDDFEDANPYHDPDSGRFAGGPGSNELPPKPGTAPIPAGHVRLYHQTSEDKLEGIRQNGITMETARGIEGPRAIYADEKGFYGKPDQVPTVEFSVPKERWDAPFVRADSVLDKGKVAPEDIVAIHYPWHAHAHYIEDNPDVLKNVLSGEDNDLLSDRRYGPAIKFIQQKHAAKDFNPNHDPQSGEFTEGGGSSGEGQEGKAEGRTGGGATERPGGAGRDPRLEQAQRSAAETASGYPKLEGLPDKPIKVGDEYYVPGPLGKAKDAAEQYMKTAGLPYDPPKQYLKVDKERAGRIADEFDKMEHAPNDPAVKASYDELAKETMAQWQAVKATGLKVDWIKPGQADPYALTPRLAAMDVAKNNHLWAFPTDLGFGSGTKEAEAAMRSNPMLHMTDEVSGGRKMMVNDAFRVVHDYFGHFKEGVGFRADGEENAWRSHSAMFSDLARGALTSETRGQNSWVNFGPYGATNRTASTADTHFAPQKIGLMPEWTKNDGRRDRVKDFNPYHDPASGQFASGGGGGVKADSFDGVKGLKQQWFSERPHQNDVAGTMADAKEAQDRLSPVVREIAAKLGVGFRDPGVKADMDRIMEKAAERNGIHNVSDLVRAAFIVDHPEQAEAITNELAKHYQIGDEPWKQTPNNYIDKALSIRDKNGAVGEIQILEAKMIGAKKEGGGHQMYKEAQRLQKGIKAGTSQDPVHDAVRIASLVQSQRTLYGNVIKNYPSEWKTALEAKPKERFKL